MRHRMWLEEIEITDKKGQTKTIEQLQYEQIVDFEFMFGASGETTQWPHIQVNTLRRIEDIPEEDRFAPIDLPEEADKPVATPKSQVCRMNHKAEN